MSRVNSECFSLNLVSWAQAGGSSAALCLDSGVGVTGLIFEEQSVLGFSGMILVNKSS